MAHVKVKEQLLGVCFLLPSHEAQGIGCQAVFGMQLNLPSHLTDGTIIPSPAHTPPLPAISFSIIVPREAKPNTQGLERWLSG